ncbi:MAG: hypothetical protein WBI24_05890 [Bacilli bacterium]
MARTIAVTAKQFRVFTNVFKINIREDFRSTPAAAKQKHFYFIVRNERINISGAFLSACGVSVSVKSRVLS